MISKQSQQLKNFAVRLIASGVQVTAPSLEVAEGFALKDAREFSGGWNWTPEGSASSAPGEAITSKQAAALLKGVRLRKQGEPQEEGSEFLWTFDLVFDVVVAAETESDADQKALSLMEPTQATEDELIPKPSWVDYETSIEVAILALEQGAAGKAATEFLQAAAADLKKLLRSALVHDNRMDAKEESPTGDDYNDLMSLLLMAPDTTLAAQLVAHRRSQVAAENQRAWIAALAAEILNSSHANILDEAINEEYAGLASGINNDGPTGQIELLAQFGWTEEMIRASARLSAAAQ